MTHLYTEVVQEFSAPLLAGNCTGISVCIFTCTRRKYLVPTYNVKCMNTVCNRILKSVLYYSRYVSGRTFFLLFHQFYIRCRSSWSKTPSTISGKWWNFTCARCAKLILLNMLVWYCTSLLLYSIKETETGDLIPRIKQLQ